MSQADAILATPSSRIPCGTTSPIRMPKALGLRPSALVLVMSPLDLTSHQEMPDVVKAAELAPPASFRQRLSGILKTVKDAVNDDSRRTLVARPAIWGLSKLSS